MVLTCPWSVPTSTPHPNLPSLPWEMPFGLEIVNRFGYKGGGLEEVA